MARHPISIEGRISLPARFDTMTTLDLRLVWNGYLASAGVGATGFQPSGQPLTYG